MAYSADMRTAAIQLRERGYSLKEISEQFEISKSTASLWVGHVVLNDNARNRLLTVIRKGQLVSAAKRKGITKATEDKYFQEALREIEIRPDHDKILCAMIFWCEGNKNPHEGVMFTNSDPKLIKTFLRLLRKSFAINDERFRACIHLHTYHDPVRQLDFWSKVTHISKQQFIKPFRKPNTGKRIRENYQGCISVRYHSTDLARRLLAVAKAFLSLGA